MGTALLASNRQQYKLYLMLRTNIWRRTSLVPYNSTGILGCSEKRSILILELPLTSSFLLEYSLMPEVV